MSSIFEKIINKYVTALKRNFYWKYKSLKELD